MPKLPAGAEPFLAAVAENADGGVWLVFADWLDDQGHAGAAAAARWMGTGNHPAHYPDYPRPWTWFVWSRGTIDFWQHHRFGGRGLLPESPVIDLSGPDREFHSNSSVEAGYWDFSTRQAAEVALLEAWPDSPR